MTKQRQRPTPPPDLDAGWPEPPIVVLDRRRALSAFDWAALAALGVAIVYGILWGALELHWGLIAIAVMGGWLIGSAASHGAWRGSLHMPSPWLRVLAALLGCAAWLGGAFVAYVVSQALFPDPATPFLQRLSFGGFADYISGVYDLVQAVALAVLALLSWRTAR